MQSTSIHLQLQRSINHHVWEDGIGKLPTFDCRHHCALKPHDRCAFAPRAATATLHMLPINKTVPLSCRRFGCNSLSSKCQIIMLQHMPPCEQQLHRAVKSTRKNLNLSLHVCPVCLCRHPCITHTPRCPLPPAEATTIAAAARCHCPSRGRYLLQLNSEESMLFFSALRRRCSREG